MTDPRLAARIAEPRLVRLHRALVPLRSTLRLLVAGAHPDDEPSGLIAALSLGRGIDVTYVCATRGQGGQNVIGGETGPILGQLRSQEMALAATRLGMAPEFLDTGLPEDPIFDFGFSRSPEDTLARWGADTVLRRLVAILRRVRPDILLPCFLDIAGQHGHHRAVTRTLLAAFDAAADPAFAPDLGAAHAVAKLYLPAWSGASEAYDDEEPPPPATVAVEIGSRDPATGMTYAQLGQWSRAAHASQGMGRWIEAGPEAAPLHLLRSRLAGSGPERDLADGLPFDLAAWAKLTTGGLARHLETAQGAIDGTLAAFPAGPELADALLAALSAVRAGRLLAPVDLAGRLDAMEARLQAAHALALGLDIRLDAPPTARPGAPVGAVLRVDHGGVAPVRPIRLAHGGGETVQAVLAPGAAVSLATEASEPLAAGLVAYQAGGESIQVAVAAPPTLFRPASWIVGLPRGALVNARHPAPVELEFTVGGMPAHPRIEADGHLKASLREVGRARWLLRLDPDVTPTLGRSKLGLVWENREPALSLWHSDHPGTGALIAMEPATVSVASIDVTLPEGRRVGLVETGVGLYGPALRQLGFAVTSLEDADLEVADWSRFDAVLLGPMAWRVRPAVASAWAGLREAVAGGLRLVSLYHRPWDTWDAERSAVRRLAIGQPSLRWRVTDPAAEPVLLVPDHPLLTGPNRLGPADWDGWVRERGLYFASDWDPGWTPLLRLADPGQPPLDGALLVAAHGHGRQVHCALALHHQIAAQVPGALRLLANLLS